MFAKFWQSHRPLFIVYVEYNGFEINFKWAFFFYGFWGFRKEGNIVFKSLPILFDYGAVHKGRPQFLHPTRLFGTQE